MIGFFRSIFQSKLGLFLTFAFVALIAVAFASADITGSTFGGVTGNDVAIVGGESIGSGEVEQYATNAQRQVQQQNPQLDMNAWVDEGGLDRVLDQLINEYALAAFGREYGMRATKRLVDSEIANIPAFAGPGGEFSETVFREILASQGLSERGVRESLARTLVGQQIVVPVAFGLRVPKQIATPLASLKLDGRRGQVAFIPSAAYVPAQAPDDRTLAAYYASNARTYTRPEQRRIRYAVVSADNLGAAAVPTDQELRAAYKTRAKEFAASETRSMTQVILPTEAAAKALAGKVAGGVGIEKAAQDIGLSASKVSDITKEKYASDFSNAAADAVFAARNGALSTPAQSSLGWHVAKIENISANPARSFADVRGDLLRELGETKRLQALTTRLETIEDRFAEGATLPEVAAAQKLNVENTPLLLSTGQAPAQSGYKPTEAVQRVLQGAFAMEQDSEPMLAELEPGMQYVVYDVSETKPAAPPPFASQRARVLRDYMLEKGAIRAKAAALKVKQQLDAGKTLKAALASLGVELPPAENIGARRIELEQSQQRVPPPLALMFSMVENTAKTIEGPANQGWYVVYLDTIDRGDASGNTAMVQSYQLGMRPEMSSELEQQFMTAVRKEVGVNRQETGIRAMRDRLTGRNQN